MRYSSTNLPESVRNKLPPSDPLSLHPSVKIEMVRAFDHGTDVAAEKELQNLICQYLNQRDIFYNWQPMNRRSQLRPGTPDFTFAYNGLPVAIEVKTETGQLSADQIRAMEKMKANRWRYYIVHSVTEVRQILRAIDDGKL